MTNTYRVKENIVHLSITAGSLLQEGGIEVESGVLTETIIDLADKYEHEIVPTLEDGEYLESIELYSKIELMNRFACTDLLCIYSMYHTNTKTGTFYFYINEETYKVRKEKMDGNYYVEGLVPTCEKLIVKWLKSWGFESEFKGISYENSILKVESKVNANFVESWLGNRK